MPPVCSAPGTFQIDLRLAGGGEVLRLPDVLAAHARRRVDQEHRPRRDLADHLDDGRRWAVVREDRRGAREHGRSGANSTFSTPGEIGLSDSEPGAFGDDRLEERRLCARSPSRISPPTDEPKPPIRSGSTSGRPLGDTQHLRSGRGRRPSGRGRPRFRPVHAGRGGVRRTRCARAFAPLSQPKLQGRRRSRHGFWKGRTRRRARARHSSRSSRFRAGTPRSGGAPVRPMCV